MLGKLIIVAVTGYLLGNVNGAILVSKLTYRDDVRKHGSGNAGLTNFFRIYGGVSTVLVLAIDAVENLCRMCHCLLFAPGDAGSGLWQNVGGLLRGDWPHVPGLFSLPRRQRRAVLRGAGADDECAFVWRAGGGIYRLSSHQPVCQLDLLCDGCGLSLCICLFLLEKLGRHRSGGPVGRYGHLYAPGQYQAVVSGDGIEI